MTSIMTTTNLQTDAVKQILVVLDVREALGNLTASREEHAVGHFPKTACQRLIWHETRWIGQT